MSNIFDSDKKKITATVSSENIILIIILTSVFLILKLRGIISWDWIWVISPLWIDTVIIIGLYIIALIIDIVINIKYFNWRYKK